MRMGRAGAYLVGVATAVFGAGALVMSLARSPASAQQGASSSGTCDHPLVLVDQEKRLPASYVPQELAYVSNYGIPDVGGGELLRQEAATNLSQMVTAAQWSGMDLTAVSGYRSFHEQQASYDYFTSIYGPSAGGVSAPPGASEHQLGTAMDLTNASAGYGLNQYFGDSPAYYWLLENARDYGFVLSYPPGAQAQTGYVWEPWHWRYVGVENAQAIVASGLTVREYTAWYGVPPHC